MMNPRGKIVVNLFSTMYYIEKKKICFSISAAPSHVTKAPAGNRSPLLLPGTAHSGFLGMAASASTMALLGFPHGAGETRGGRRR